MTAYRDRVFGARVIVTSFTAAYRHRVNGARVNVTSLCGSLQGQSLWCKGNCNEFVCQLTGTDSMLQG